jgi:type II secretory pathway component PulL
LLSWLGIIEALRTQLAQSTTLLHPLLPEKDHTETVELLARQSLEERVQGGGNTYFPTNLFSIVSSEISSLA